MQELRPEEREQILKLSPVAGLVDLSVLEETVWLGEVIAGGSRLATFPRNLRLVPPQPLGPLASAHFPTPRRYAATTPPLPVNGLGQLLAMLGAVNFNLTPPSREVRRTTTLSLTLRVSRGGRSLLGQIVVILQRRLALAQPDAKPAKENQCN